MNHSREDVEFERKRKRKTEEAWSTYLGKRDLLITYENQGIHNDYTNELRREVRRRQQYLVNRGEL